MPLSDQQRIALDLRRPRIVDLWFALQGLKSVVSFMQSGAHPDDEQSAMLAALRFRDGFATSYACAVRGEGGQNDIGTEATRDLGVLRTAEMERAADVLDMTVYWLSESPEDSIFDFGFSKSGVDTLEKWDHDRVLRRFVEIVRTEKPDILCPTFLDIPGQHGHHRAMTQAAHEVIEAAADPGFASNLAPWQVAKLYLPAWSGAGGSYDDEVPPPPASLTVDVSGSDPVTGWSWERIGQQSRAFHRTQGMGRWVPVGAEKDRPLHLAVSKVGGEDHALTDGLPTGLEDFRDRAGAMAKPLRAAAKALGRTLKAFPDCAKTLRRATEALRHVREARDLCPEDLRPALLHRLDRKEAELARVIRLAAGVDVIGHVAQDWLRPGEVTDLTIETRTGTAGVAVSVDLPKDWIATGGAIGPGAKAGPTDPYPSIHDPLSPRAPALRVEVTGLDAVSVSWVPLLVPPVALPHCVVALEPPAGLLNTARASRELKLEVTSVEAANASLTLPDGWSAAAAGSGFHLTLPTDVADGLYRVPVSVEGDLANCVTRIAYPHIAPRARAVSAEFRLRVVHAALPDVRVGYIGGGADRVAHWMRAMGLDVTEIDDDVLADAARLAAFDSIVIGIFALRFRPGLRAAMPGLHDWVRAGGHLVTLYHRPWDNWDPDTVPPVRLEIGQPSLRWRVTDETAIVRHLAPEHALLNVPNVIGPQDWDGWHKERGLYFAKSWDDAYVPLLGMADPGETPHRGALLSATVGRGRHTHCALILHHQMEKLTPGAFRLMANLVA